jgi:hypothetical protein
MINYIQNYQRKLKEHVKGVDTGGISEQILCYQPRGQKSIGYAMKREAENMRP